MDASGLKAEASGHVNPLHIDLLTCVPVTYAKHRPQAKFLGQFLGVRNTTDTKKMKACTCFSHVSPSVHLFFSSLSLN